MCVLCHVADGGTGAAEFTDYSYDNLGLPVNPLIADKGVDPGLGGFIASVLAAPGDYPETLVTEISAGDGESANRGKTQSIDPQKYRAHPTLRPQRVFPKPYLYCSVLQHQKPVSLLCDWGSSSHSGTSGSGQDTWLSEDHRLLLAGARDRG